MPTFHSLADISCFIEDISQQNRGVRPGEMRALKTAFNSDPLLSGFASKIWKKKLHCLEDRFKREYPFRQRAFDNNVDLNVHNRSLFYSERALSKEWIGKASCCTLDPHSNKDDLFSHHKHYQERFQLFFDLKNNDPKLMSAFDMIGSAESNEWPAMSIEEKEKFINCLKNEMLEYSIFIFKEFEKKASGFLILAQLLDLIDSPEQAEHYVFNLGILLSHHYYNMTAYKDEIKKFFDGTNYSCMPGLEERLYDATTYIRFNTEKKNPMEGLSEKEYYIKKYVDLCTDYTLDPFMMPNVFLSSLYAFLKKGPYQLTECSIALAIRKNMSCDEYASLQMHFIRLYRKNPNNSLDKIYKDHAEFMKLKAIKKDLNQNQTRIPLDMIIKIKTLENNLAPYFLQTNPDELVSHDQIECIMGNNAKKLLEDRLCRFNQQEYEQSLEAFLFGLDSSDHEEIKNIFDRFFKKETISFKKAIWNQDRTQSVLDQSHHDSMMRLLSLQKDFIGDRLEYCEENMMRGYIQTANKNHISFLSCESLLSQILQMHDDQIIITNELISRNLQTRYLSYDVMTRFAEDNPSLDQFDLDDQLEWISRIITRCDDETIANFFARIFQYPEKNIPELKWKFAVYCAENGLSKSLEVLLDTRYNNPVNVHTRDADRYIAYCLIDLAAINGHCKIVEMLMNVNSPQITLSALGQVLNQLADRRMLDLLLPQFTKEEIITANVMREAIARHDLWLIKKLLALNIPIPAAALHILAENPLDHFPFYRLVVDFLIDEVGVDVNQLDQYQMTPLHRAKNSTDLYLVNKLLHHPYIDLSKKDFLGETPVLKMIKMKSLRLFSIFLKKRKYDTSDTNHEGKNLLHYLFEGNLFENNRNIMFLSGLVKRNPFLSRTPDNQGVLPIMRAVEHDHNGDSIQILMSLFENDSRFNITEELKRKDNTENTLTHYAARNSTLTGLNAIRSYINDDYKALNTRKETPFLIALKRKNIHFAEAIFNIDPFCLNVRTICALKKFTSNDLEILRNLMRETPSPDQELNTIVSQLTKETIRTTLFNDEQVYILKNILKDNHRLYSMLIMDEDNHLIDSIMLLVQYAPTHIEFAIKILTRYPRAALYQHKNGTNLLDMILQYPLGVYSNTRLKALYLEFISQAIDINPSLLFQRDAKGLTTIMRFMNMNYKDRDIEPQVVDLLLKDPKGYLLSDNKDEQNLLSDMKGNTIAHLAVKNFALQGKILEQILTTIPHANARNHDGLTPLMYAIRCRHSGAISVMMDFPLKVDINLTGENEEPLLNIAITKNLSVECSIKKMIQHPGLNLQQRDKDGVGMIEFILKRRKLQIFDKLSRIHSLDLNELNSQGQPLLFELINFWSSTLETLDKYKRNKLKREFLETLDLFCQSSTQHSPFTCFNMDAHLLDIIKLLDNVPERKDIISRLLINPGFDPKKTNHDGYTFFNWAKKEGDEILLSCLKESNHMLEGDDQQDGAILLSRQSNDHAITSTPMICFSTPSLTNSKKRKRSLSERLHP